MKTTFAILIAVTSLLMGYFFRDALAPPVKSQGLDSSATEKISSRTRTISAHRQSLERTIRIPDATQRWLRVVALLEKATLGEMQGIAESVEFSDERITKLVAQRWFDLDPQHFFEASLEEMNRTARLEKANFACFRFMNFLAEEWAHHDPEAALKAFSQNHPDPWLYFEDYQCDFFNHLAKVDLDKALELNRTLDIGIRIPRRAIQHDPHAVAQTIFSHFHTQDQKDVTDLESMDPFSPGSWTEGGTHLNSLAEIWGMKNPIEALAFANSHDTDQGRYLRDKIVKTWFANDQEAAAQWLNQQDRATREKYQLISVKAWATDDPRAALAWCTENLRESPSFETTVRTLIEGALESDPVQALQLLPALESDHHRLNAVSEITKKWFSRGDPENIPVEAIDWVRDLGNSRMGQSAMKNAGELWAKRDPDGMRAFLEEDRDFEYPPAVYTKLVEAFADRDPVAALAWTSGLGEHSGRHSQTATQLWLSKSPETAINWLRSSPENPEAAAAMRESIASWIGHEFTTEQLNQNLGIQNQAWVKTHFERGVFNPE